MKKQITRKDYMENPSELFHEYYMQFVTPATVRFIESEIGIEKLKTSKDRHLNDLYSHSHGGSGSWIWDFSPINTSLLKDLGENNSSSTHTCVAKACARDLMEKEGIPMPTGNYLD